MAQMMSKKQVSNLVVLVVAMVLMANYFVSCENTNIGDVESDHHIDGNNTKASHDLAHHHHTGQKMKVDGVPGGYCPGNLCSVIEQDCDGHCVCYPAFVFYGICGGSCC